MRFINIDLDKHRDIVTKFRKDSFVVSFGDTSEFDEEGYLHWLEEKKTRYPDGFALVEEGGKIIGQLELSIRKYRNRTIGYINLYYLIPEKRGKGLGKELHKYVERFFRSNNVNEYHLRVSPANIFAIKFYKKIGMKEVGPEMGGKVIRMKGYL